MPPVVACISELFTSNESRPRQQTTTCDATILLDGSTFWDPHTLTCALFDPFTGGRCIFFSRLLCNATLADAVASVESRAQHMAECIIKLQFQWFGVSMWVWLVPQHSWALWSWIYVEHSLCIHIKYKFKRLAYFVHSHVTPIFPHSIEIHKQYSKVATMKYYMQFDQTHSHNLLCIDASESATCATLSPSKQPNKS